MIYNSLCEQARRVSARSLARPMSREAWKATEEDRRESFLDMLGLDPLPERAPLHTTITGILDRDSYVVEKLHFQSLPGAYVPANLYRPKEITDPLPAVLYLCGHTKGKVNPPYQANPRWFGQHGFVAMVVDPIQLGEAQGVHHGTYSMDRWDWISRGYSPAAAEVWNAMRAVDTLRSREDVCPERIGVTGLSGGGVISWLLGAADPRVKCVAPVCQTGTIDHVIRDRQIDGHCDCAFFINKHQWCVPDLGALIAPRALLIAAGTEDVLWRPHGWRDAADRIRKQYIELEAPEAFDLVEDVSPHGYTPKLRQAIFSWFRRHLADDPAPVTDDVSDRIEREEDLLVFGGKLPEDDAMRTIDITLVARAPKPSVVSPEDWEEHQSERLVGLLSLACHWPEREEVRILDVRDGGSEGGMAFVTYELESADGVPIAMRLATPEGQGDSVPLVMFPLSADAWTAWAGGGSERPRFAEAATACVEVRGTGRTSMGPGLAKTVRRAYPLLGWSLPERQAMDLLAARHALFQAALPFSPISLYGIGAGAVIAVYAALCDLTVDEVILADPPESHESPMTPEIPGILRTGDLPENLALAHPRTVTFVDRVPRAYRHTRDQYERLGSGERFRVIASTADWTAPPVRRPRLPKG